jgi:hypothetical protein
MWQPGPIPVPPEVYVSCELCWDAIGLAQAQVALGIIGVIAAVGAVLYARTVANRQFRMLEDQDKLLKDQVQLIREQRDIAGQLKVLSTEQKTILEQQGSIAQRQQAIMEQELARRAVLAMEMTRAEHQPAAVTVYTLQVTNSGQRSAETFYWHFYVPQFDAHPVGVQMVTGVGPTGTRVMQEVPHHDYSGFQAEPVFPGRSFHMGIVTIPDARLQLGAVTVFWSISAEDGMFPGPTVGYLTVSIQAPVPIAQIETNLPIPETQT